MLILMCGLPFCGKSSYIRDNFNNEEQIISLSEIRKGIPDYLLRFNKTIVGARGVKLAEDLLRSGKTVVIDSPNITYNSRQHYISVAKRLGIKTKIIYQHASIDYILDKNRENGSPIKEDILIKLYNILDIPSYIEVDVLEIV